MTDCIYPINPKARAKMAGIVNKIILRLRKRLGRCCVLSVVSNCTIGLFQGGAIAFFVACAVDGTKPCLSPSAKQRRNPCFGPSPVYQDLSMRHDWPGKKAIVDLPIKMKGNSKHISGNSLSPLGAKNKDQRSLLRRRY